VSATVWKALCVPLNELVAIKCLDLECSSSLAECTRPSLPPPNTPLLPPQHPPPPRPVLLVLLRSPHTALEWLLCVGALWWWWGRQDDIRKEAQMMSMISHANLVRAHCSFSVGQFLWVVMPFCRAGSCLT